MRHTRSDVDDILRCICPHVLDEVVSFAALALEGRLSRHKYLTGRAANVAPHEAYRIHTIKYGTVSDEPLSVCQR